MLERTYLEDIHKSMEELGYPRKSHVSNNSTLEKRRSKRKARDSLIVQLTATDHLYQTQKEEKKKEDDKQDELCVMTRQTRNRKPRISALQSGYCAVCNLPYNNVEDHIQSKKHQKLIGEDANYIALNGSLNGFLQTNGSLPFLQLNGIDAIGVHETSLDDLSSPAAVLPLLRPPTPPQSRRRTAPPPTSTPTPSAAMRRSTRAVSMLGPPRGHAQRHPMSPPPAAEATPTLLPPTSHHRLRSRRTVNYALDEDSLHEDEGRELRSNTSLMIATSTPTTTKAVIKVPERVSPEPPEEVWNSGRPKRMCIRQKRAPSEEKQQNNHQQQQHQLPQKTFKMEMLTARQRAIKEHELRKQQLLQSPKREKDERAQSEEKPHPNNNQQPKTYYKVEVLTPRQRSMKEQEAKRQQSQSPKRDKEDEKDKGLIVKFKKLRNSELIQLNNEATNFLFPKKEESSDEDDDDGNDEEEECSVINIDSSTESSVLSCHDLSMDSNVGDFKTRTDDEASMDSTATTSSTIKKRRRMTQAEAFILDNQKYYKFETPGSRLRYHGSYLPSIGKTPSTAVCDKGKDITETKRLSRESKVKVDNYKFSFERVPEHSSLLEAFRRQDTGNQKYTYFSDNSFWDPFILPYQIPYITPLDPRACRTAYRDLLRCLLDPEIRSNVPESSTDVANGNGIGETDCSASVASVSSASDGYDVIDAATLSMLQDEDSKMSLGASSVGSATDLDGGRNAVTATNVKRRRSKAALLQQLSLCSNPRKSPRQHASTLAILSSFLQQRKRRSKSRLTEEQPASDLPTVCEDIPTPQEPTTQEACSQPPQEPEAVSATRRQNVGRRSFPRTHRREHKPHIDYQSIARGIDEELDTALDEENFALLEIEDTNEPSEVENATVDFHKSRVNVSEIMRLYDEEKRKETVKSCRRFFHSTPGRKPGVRKKKKVNMTGWPNKIKRSTKRGYSKEKDDNDNSTVGSGSVKDDSEEEVNSNPPMSTLDEEPADVRTPSPPRHESTPPPPSVADSDSKVLKMKVTNNGINSTDTSFVLIRRLDAKVGGRTTATCNNRGGLTSPATCKRAKRRSRHIPGSPKSPRALRRPRGRWYKER